MATLVHDLRYAVRLLRAKPGFAAVAILTLALGVGAATAIFSVVHAVLLSPLPFRDADRLMNVHITSRDGATFPLPDTDFIAWRAQNRTADVVAVFENDAVTLTGDGAPERVAGAAVTDRFFDVLGARPLIGRVLQDGDDRPGAAKTALISHGLWTRRFHGDPSIVGRTVALNGESHIIVGVMPAAFRFPDARVDVWRVLTTNPPRRRGPFYTWGIARLKPAVGIAELRVNLDAISNGLKRDYPGPNDWVLTAIPLQDSIVGDVRTILYALLGAVGVLLLIAATNVANLLLARAAARDREIAVRAALGAGRGRIAAQLVTESLVLALAAGAAGMIIASWGTRGLLAIAPQGIPRLAEVRMSVPVFVFTFAVAALCGVLFGVAPALRASRTPLVETLKEGGRSGPGVSHRRAQRLLVVAEIALALMLSVGAGLMIRSFAALQRVSPGFEPSHLLTFRISLPRAQYDTSPKVRDFYLSLVQRLEALPGVRAAGLTISLPPHLLQMTDNFMTEGMTLPPDRSAPVGPLLFVSERYFSALGTPLLRGRFFTERDDRGAPEVVIVNEALAKQYFAGENPIGKRLKNGGPERPIGPDNRWMTVVGVVGDVNYSGLDVAPEPTVYYPFRQAANTTQYVVVRTAGDPTSVASAARDIVAALDKDLPIANLATMDEMMAASVAAPRFRTTLVAIFAAVGLLLAAIGIYGVMSYAVTERTREIGVRAALGAGRGDVLRLVLGETILLAGVGVGVGVAGALATTRLIRALLFHVEPTDSATFAAIALILFATALIASYIPARRALRVDPMVALRYE
jgi:putative ABC transport system permease protein